MSRPLRLAVAAAGVVGGLALLRVGTVLPVDLNDAEDGVIRLSWRVRSVGVEECREPDPAAERGVPEHMRPPDACERRALPFRLRVRLDGRNLVDERIQPAGARADRPVYVYREIPVHPGRHRLEVRFRSTPTEDREAGAAAARHLRLAWDDTVELAAGEAVVLTYVPERERLELRGR